MDKALLYIGGMSHAILINYAVRKAVYKLQYRERQAFDSRFLWKSKK